MARAPDTGDAFIREVDDEYRRDRVAGLWSRYGRWLLVAVGVALVVAAAFLFWRQQRAEQADARALAYGSALTALRDGREQVAAPVLRELSDAPEPGYRALARLAQAAVTARAQPAAAAARYEVVARDTAVAAPFRDLATFKATQLRFDTLPPAEVVSRLRPLAQPGGPWFGPAAELSAIAYLRQGQPALARPLLQAVVNDVRQPATLRGRVRLLLAGVPAPVAPRASR